MHHHTMNAAERTPWVCEQARAIGFDLCGVAAIAPAAATRDSPSRNSSDGTFEEFAYLPEWLARDYAGEMNYLRDPRRADPRLALEGARSVIVVAMNYSTPEPRSVDQPRDAVSEISRGWISRYAWGDDYHEILREKLNALVVAMRAEF